MDSFVKGNLVNTFYVFEWHVPNIIDVIIKNLDDYFFKKVDTNNRLICKSQNVSYPMFGAQIVFKTFFSKAHDLKVQKSSNKR